MSFAGCISTIFKVVAEKMRINVDKLEIESEAEKGKETIEKVTFNVKVKSDASEDKLEKCLETTCNTCPVGVLFKNAGVKIERNLIKL
jgi:putative redox protein